MCRRYFVWSGILIAFGAGVLLSLTLDSVLLRLILGVGSGAWGMWLLKCGKVGIF